jgi:hypothetical protein
MFAICVPSSRQSPKVAGRLTQEPNLSGDFLAVIEAAWTEDGTTKCAVRSVMTGNMGEIWLQHVQLLEKQ